LKIDWFSRQFSNPLESLCKSGRILKGVRMTRILIVDDEQMIREELKESLEFEDFEVTTAASALEALEICKKNEFDCIVTDLKMPNMGGLELLGRLRDENVKSRFFVVSGHGAESSREDAMGLGAEACLAKPLDVDLLINEINKK
jgi:CheY-like chemotaxis protein